MPNIDYVHHLAFPKLSEQEVASVAGIAKLCSFEDGETIFQAGHAVCRFTSFSRERSQSSMICAGPGDDRRAWPG